MALKLEMSKAFDLVEWVFLDRVMKQLGFNSKWCNLIHKCICNTDIQILLNGSLGKAFKPTMGIRQGDPISLYLLLLTMEVFTRALAKAESERKIQGIKISRKSPQVTHLLFADDCMVFAKVDIHNVTNLLNSEDKLWAQDLKGRYFPTTSDLHANKNKNSTWSWQSIHGSMQFIFKHSLFLVGNGQKISIWTDIWIQGKQEPPIPVVELEIANTYNTISDLIDYDTKSWKKRILQRGEDRLIWTLTRNGVFTIKSAYQRLVEMKNGAPVIDTTTTTLPRVKHFLWQCMVDIVPSNERMGRVLNYSEEQCKMCKQDIETTRNMLWECSFTRAIWFTTPRAKRSMRSNNSSVQELIQSWFDNEFNNLVEDWTVKMENTLWEIWITRWKKMLKQKHNGDNNMHHTIQLWKPPLSPYNAFSCDAYFKIINQITYSGWGLIIRSFAGEFIQARCGYSNGLISAEEAECMGLLYATQCAEDLNIQFSFFEMDAELVIKEVNGSLHHAA
ncbi:uncharacterized protein LOC113280062 [Papaver somniferum]|uniref:uncharacterized protein LOC113280062 n=1 Tax=Papaver somniferum TaxID=3469 RepID=UPI000E6F7121|nr:uncharacterized protein LOC113280062 [Papaver somniferum]